MQICCCEYVVPAIIFYDVCFCVCVGFFCSFFIRVRVFEHVKILVNLPEELHCFGPASKRMYHTVVGVRELPSCMWQENENNWGRIQGTSSSLATAR